MKRVSLMLVGVMVFLRPVLATTYYVWENSPKDGPGTSWAKAFHTIQGGVNAATTPGDIVLVTNGVYDVGTAVTPGHAASNRVVITAPITVRSVNGARHTSIKGAEATGGGMGSDAVRGVYMTDGILEGFTITNGYTADSGDTLYDRSGGGLLAVGGGSLLDCKIVGNGARFGGGAYGGSLYRCRIEENASQMDGGGTVLAVLFNCIIARNSAGASGGGDVSSLMRNCTIVSNFGQTAAGGCALSTGINCIIYFNTSLAPGVQNTAGGSYQYTCSPGLTNNNNIPDDPQMKNVAGRNYRLTYGSPCIDSGLTLALVPDDIDGNARPVDGDFDTTATYDRGAYEYRPTAMDSDSDGRVDADEYSEGLDPSYDESFAISYGEAAVTNAPGAYGLYTSNSIMDLSMGQLMLQMSNGTTALLLQMQQNTNLSSSAWSNAADPVNWNIVAPEDKDFFRVWSVPP